MWAIYQIFTPFGYGILLYWALLLILNVGFALNDFLCRLCHILPYKKHNVHKVPGI